jgi:hypothetical protein
VAALVLRLATVFLLRERVCVHALKERQRRRIADLQRRARGRRGYSQSIAADRARWRGGAARVHSPRAAPGRAPCHALGSLPRRLRACSADGRCGAAASATHGVHARSAGDRGARAGARAQGVRARALWATSVRRRLRWASTGKPSRAAGARST